MIQILNNNKSFKKLDLIHKYKPIINDNFFMNSKSEIKCFYRQRYCPLFVQYMMIFIAMK